jgi:hypothetical protein
MDTNFLVCSVDTVPETGVVTIIPFRNTYSGSITHFTSEIVHLTDAAWGWKVTVVIGTDRNMFSVSFYPNGDDLVSTLYLVEPDTNVFFTASSSPATLITSTSTAFNIDALISN